MFDGFVGGGGEWSDRPSPPQQLSAPATFFLFYSPGHAPGEEHPGLSRSNGQIRHPAIIGLLSHGAAFCVLMHCYN
ncbi:hypothetical protein [Zoogloea sp.]|uniref:hypothetical protein n=1 Tax=Zoogloea sp. TaxID=49181 RepID=UPI002628ACDB|nr:hypothetical protein [Zoogloea sp.]